MWGKKRLEPNAKKIKYYFMDCQIRKLYTLFDTCNRQSGKLPDYELWEYVYDCFPGLDIRGSAWELNVSNILRPCIVRTGAKE